MTGNDFETVAYSVEPSRMTYLLRRTVIALLVAAAVVAGWLVATGRFPASTSVDTASADAAATEEEAPVVPVQDTAVETDDTQAPAAPETTVPPIELPERASAFQAQPPERVLDTRNADQPEPPAPDSSFPVAVPDGRTAVALSISVLQPTRGGAVLVDGRAGVVEAITLPGAGMTTTNLVVVPVVGDEVVVRSTAGGHLVVDVVGSFAPADEASGGRFVPVEPTRITRLETAVEGNDTTIEFSSEPRFSDATALLVSVDADVGSDGGMVRLGDSSEDFDQMLMWSPTSEDNRNRRGLAIIQPTEEGLASLRYDGGALLTVDVLGYFTDDPDEGTGGYFVPAGPRLLHDGTLPPEGVVEVTDVDPRASAALVTVGARNGVPGQLGLVLVPVENGTIQFSSGAELDSVVTLLGLFVS